MLLNKIKKPSIIPAFGVTFGFTVLYLLIIVIIPLSGLFFQTASLSWEAFFEIISNYRVIHAFYISFGLSFIAALINLFLGLMIAWMLVRYQFFGKKFFDALIDLPFALPTAVAGIALTTLYAPQGWIGQYLEPLGLKIAFTPLGILMALIFIGLPFVVRSVQPVLEDMEKELEEVASSLGASRWQIFFYVILPHIFPALMTGFAMAFARGLGEYGSVIFIAGNIPKISEIVPLLIVIKLEQYDYTGATAIALVMLIISFFILLLVNMLQKWSQRHMFKG